ncbi:MAG: hypothetical protein Q4B73_06685 [Lachnospiraceae bacterium]|nr:hypothetical protein [Lachnospiraceae bacterium]
MSENYQMDAKPDVAEADIRRAYREQIDTELEKDSLMIDLMKKQIRMSHVLSAIMGGVLVLMIILSIVLVPKVTVALTETSKAISTVNESLAPKLEELDMVEVNKAIKTLEGAVGALDVAALNDGVTDLTDAISKIDINSLNKAVDNLNVAVQPLVKLVEVFGG